MTESGRPNRLLSPQVPPERWAGGLGLCTFSDGLVHSDVGSFPLPADVTAAAADGADMSGYERAARQAIWAMWNAGKVKPRLPTWKNWSATN